MQGAPGSISGQGTIFHMPQLRIHVPQLIHVHAVTKTWHGQINRFKKNAWQPSEVVTFVVLTLQMSKMGSRIRATQLGGSGAVPCCCCAQSCPTLFDPIDCILPGSSIHGLLQARITGVGLPCPPPGDLRNSGIKPVSLTSPVLAGRFFTTSTIWEAQWS